MKLSKWIILGGIVVLILGLIFHLQGQSVVGPQTSFMYSNPEWVNYGTQIAIVGIIIVAFGSMIQILDKFKG